MPEQKRQWTVIRIDDKVMDSAGKFFSIGDKFAGSPKPMLKKVEEKIEKF